MTLDNISFIAAYIAHWTLTQRS